MNEPSTFTAQEWRIIGITSAGHALCHISELAYAAVIGAVMLEFELPPDRAAALAVPGFVLYGVGAVPAGLWTDRRGAREVLTTYFALVALAALSVCLVRDVWQLGVALALLGLAISLYHPAGLTMISHGCQRRGRAMGINGIAGSLGVAMGPTLGLSLASWGHWRAAYGIIAAIGVAAFAACWVFPLTDTQHERRGPAESKPVSPLGHPAMLTLLFVAMLLGGLNYRCLTTALPSFVSGASSDSVAEASAGGSGGLMVFLIFAMGGLGQWVGGHLADRYRPPWVYVVVILATVPCALIMAHASSSAVVVAAGVLAVFMFAQQPLENVMIAEATPIEWRSTVYGLKFILAFGLASIGAYLTGWIWQREGLARVFDVFAAIGLAMAALAAIYAQVTVASSRSP